MDEIAKRIIGIIVLFVGVSIMLIRDYLISKRWDEKHKNE